MDPLSLSPTDEGGASQDILQRRRERERNRREQETAEQREERLRKRRQRDRARTAARRNDCFIAQARPMMFYITLVISIIKNIERKLTARARESRDFHVRGTA